MTRRAPCRWKLAALVLSVVMVGGAAVGNALPADDHHHERAQLAAELGFPLDYDEWPIPERITKPVYPTAAFLDCIEGTVAILIAIDAKGTVSATRVVESKKGLDEAALACVKEWRFKPARKGGEAVGSVALAPVKFRIYDEKDKNRSACAGRRPDPVK